LAQIEYPGLRRTAFDKKIGAMRPDAPNLDDQCAMSPKPCRTQL
jgi:hypothetical protein